MKTSQNLAAFKRQWIYCKNTAWEIGWFYHLKEKVVHSYII